MARQFDITEGPHVLPQVLAADGTGRIVLPEGTALFSADFERRGADLVLSHDGAAGFRIPGYFLNEMPADISVTGGALLRGEHVALLAGPIAPGQYAQAGAAPGAGPIGQVETLSGDVSVLRVDGTTETLQIGMKIFQQDVLQTGPDATLSVTFVDGTIFSLSAGSRMIIDELIFDPNASDNSGTFSLIQGSFVFIAGQVAKTGGMDVNTPSATMGIRGTTVVAKISSDQGVVVTEITLAQDIDGEIGRIDLRDPDGNLIADITETDVKWVVRAFDGGVREVLRDAQDDLADSLLIAEAFAAFRSAAGRVAAGDTFVSLSDPGVFNQNNTDNSAPDVDLELDSLDEPTAITPSTPLEEVPEPAPDAPLDEGFNRQQIDDGPALGNVIVVEGPEDPDPSTAIAGSAATGALVGQAFTLAQAPGNGSVSVTPQGGFAFLPNPDFNGTDSFVFTATSAGGVQTSVTVIVKVLPVNDSPEASDIVTAVDEDSVVAGTIPASDVDGDVLSYSVTGLPAHGEVILFQNGNFAYTPDPNYSGTDSFVVSVTDPAGETAQSTVTVTIAEQSDAPTILTTVAQVTRAVLETDAAIVVGGLLEAEDPDPGAILTWSGSETRTLGAFAVTTGGAWTFTLDAVAADVLADGQVVTEIFTAVVTDEEGLTEQIDIPITITGSDDAPRLTSDPSAALGQVTEGAEEFEVGGQLTAEDPDLGGTVTWAGVSAAAYGTFTFSETGDWTYRLDNALADVLTAGQSVTERFEAVATDGTGNTTPQTIEVTVIGTNDAPVVPSVTLLKTIESTAITGQLTATDIDGPDDQLAYSLANAENGTVALGADGSFTFTPDVGFLGVARFDYTVSDALGGVTPGVAQVFVESDPDSLSNQNVGVGVNLTATADTAAGAVEITVNKTDVTSLNLAIALDRSGSIGAADWGDLLIAVRTSVMNLMTIFEGSDTQVDVQIITYASDVDATPVFDLYDPALLDAIDAADLLYKGGGTAWNLAFQKTGEFFFSEPSDELSYLLFVTDGVPSSGTWVAPFDVLVNPADDYDITVDAFGYGRFYQPGSLDALDDDPVEFTEPQQLSDAFQTSPIFNPDLIGFTVTVVANPATADEKTTQIATQSSPGLIEEGFNFELPLAGLPGLVDALGETNRIEIRAEFDLDNDLSNAEVTLFRTETIGKAASAQTLTGLAGPDLLFGSDEDDTISGGAGGDVIFGYGGDDTLVGGGGADTILAGAGNDLIRVAEVTEAGDIIDGGLGRDVLAFDAVGEINALIGALEISGIEALDMTNGQIDNLALTLDEVINFSEEDDTVLQDLLGAAFGKTRSFLGDVGDKFTIDGQGIYSFEKNGIETDADGNSFEIYTFSIGGGNPLATLGIDTDIEVTPANMVA